MESGPESPLQIARKRCAIYTRKSGEHGLQQDFNTLDWALQRTLFGFAEQPPMQLSERY
jgi:hypothetical protein